MGVKVQTEELTESELEMYDVEKLRRLLPRAGEATEQTQLDIILRAIQYIQALQQDLVHAAAPTTSQQSDIRQEAA